jgi:tetratricopeptide (TPR) repeat protein
MGLFDKLFRKKPRVAHSPSAPAESPKIILTKPPSTPPAPIAAAAGPRKDDLITVYDPYGRQLQIGRTQWRDSVLLPNIKTAWDDADRLYTMLASALTDGFRDEVLPGVEHLYQLDPNRVEYVVLWAIVLREVGRLDESEAALQRYLTKHGDDATVLNNLAKVFSKRGDIAQQDATLWRALQTDPNLENAVVWFQAIAREAGGATAAHEAMEKLAALPGSWRAQLGLAREALDAKSFDQAIAYYRDVLVRAEPPYAADMLMQISGDLGNHERIADILTLIAPVFNPEQHGVMVGNNLIKALVETGDLDQARKILEGLYACKRPDWQQTLSYWDTQLAKARIAAAPAPELGSIQATMLALENPIWLPKGSPAWAIFPAKAQDEFSVCFLGSTATMPNTPDRIEQQLSDTPGRLSRVVPLILAEYVHFMTKAKVQTLVPMLTGDSVAFMFASAAWTDEDALEHAKKCAPPADFIVVTHLIAQAEPFAVQVRLLRVPDGAVLATFEKTFNLQNLGELMALPASVAAELFQHTDIQPIPPSPLYRMPVIPQFAFYLLRLEQLLAVRAPGGMHLNGEREIINGMIQLCLDCPDNVPARLVLSETIHRMNTIRPQVVAGFAEKIARLQREKPLGETLDAITANIIASTES